MGCHGQRVVARDEGKKNGYVWEGLDDLKTDRQNEGGSEQGRIGATDGELEIGLRENQSKEIHWHSGCWALAYAQYIM